jgi:DNA-directed RNA polymerase specialized sigma subunit
MHDDLTALMTRAGDGDKEAWDGLVERYAPLIWSICRRYGWTGQMPRMPAGASGCS